MDDLINDLTAKINELKSVIRYNNANRELQITCTAQLAAYEYCLYRLQCIS